LIYFELAILGSQLQIISDVAKIRHHQLTSRNILLVIVVNTKHMPVTVNFLRPNLNSDPRIGPGVDVGYHWPPFISISIEV